MAEETWREPKDVLEAEERIPYLETNIRLIQQDLDGDRGDWSEGAARNVRDREKREISQNARDIQRLKEWIGAQGES